MKRGAWHQFGDKSQKLVEEQLENGVGVGVILSPRDLARHKAIEYSQKYHDLNAHVLIDEQFYVPRFTNRNLLSYPISHYRQIVTESHQITDTDLSGFAEELENIHNELLANGLISPALVYEAGRPDIIQLNAKLFSTAKIVGNSLGIPTYATVFLGRSVTSTEDTISNILSSATALDADGWYFGFEFDPERIPSSRDHIYKCCAAGITLACTGKPVMHAYAGPLALLSLGFGANTTAIGHNQNLWKFSRGRWLSQSERGGGGEAPPRFFSSSIWGTIIYPDELILLPPNLTNNVITHSPFSSRVSSSTPYLSWSRWEANKHFVHMICKTVERISNQIDPRDCAMQAINLLENANNLIAQILSNGISLRDRTTSYQANWLTAIRDIMSNRSSDYDYLNLLRS